MKQRNLPVWQQVLLVVLRDVPEHENGTDAWQRLSPEEQSAVMDYLTLHCGDDAHARLDETCAKIKHSKWWMSFWLTFAAIILIVALIVLNEWMENWIDLHPFLMLPIILRNLRDAWQGNPAAKVQQIWHKHVDTQEGIADALRDMHQAYTVQRRSTGYFVLWLVLLVLYAFVALADIFVK